MIFASFIPTNPIEIGIIAVVVLVLFGGPKLAGFGKHLGEGMKEFKKATKEAVGDSEEPQPETQPTSAASSPAMIEQPKTAEPIQAAGVKPAETVSSTKE